MPEIKKLYKPDIYDCNITKVFDYRENEKHCWVQKSPDQEFVKYKRAGCHYFQTFQQAKDWLIIEMEENVTFAKQRLCLAENALEHVKNLTQPTEE